MKIKKKQKKLINRRCGLANREQHQSHMYRHPAIILKHSRAIAMIVQLVALSVADQECSF